MSSRPALQAASGRPPARRRLDGHRGAAPPSSKALASLANSARVLPDRETPMENATAMYTVGIDQGANMKELKRLQSAGIIRLHQAHDLEG